MHPSSKFAFLALTGFLFTGCSSAPSLATTKSSAQAAKTYSAGEKASVGKLTYSIVDTQILPRLGEEGEVGRTPKSRFYLIQVSVSNGGNEEISVPSMTLVADSSDNFNELTDGTGVPQWLGVVRRVRPGDSLQGNVVFDVEPAHYKLKLTDDLGQSEVYVDLPLAFQAGTPKLELPEPVVSGGDPAPQIRQKK